MTIQEFKKQIKEAELRTSKQHGLEVIDVKHDSTELFSVTYAEIYDLSDVNSLLVRHLRPEYIPPLG